MEENTIGCFFSEHSVECNKLHLAAGLSPDPLGSSQRSPGPLAVLGEEKGREGERVAMENAWLIFHPSRSLSSFDLHSLNIQPHVFLLAKSQVFYFPTF